MTWGYRDVVAHVVATRSREFPLEMLKLVDDRGALRGRPTGCGRRLVLDRNVAGGQAVIAAVRESVETSLSGINFYTFSTPWAGIAWYNR